MAKPLTGCRGVPGRTPCQRQGIVRYTASQTPDKKVRPAFEGPDFLVGRENVFVQSAPQGRQRGHVFILAGGM